MADGVNTGDKTGGCVGIDSSGAVVGDSSSGGIVPLLLLFFEPFFPFPFPFDDVDPFPLVDFFPLLPPLDDFSIGGEVDFVLLWDAL